MKHSNNQQPTPSKRELTTNLRSTKNSELVVRNFVKCSYFGGTITALLTSVSLIGLMSWMAPTSYQPTVENDFIKLLKKKSTETNAKLPEERVYLQFDKSFYNPGETIWFSAYLRNGQNFKPSGQSDILNVEFINPKGSVEKTIRLIARNGKVAGDFTLDEEAPGGLYKVRAYTNWMKNEGRPTPSPSHKEGSMDTQVLPNGEDLGGAFEKEITVQDVVLPALKMKLDFDRKAFGAGDEVSALIKIETNENKPLSSYKIKYVAQIGGEKIAEEATITDYIGEKHVKFNLPAKLKTNDGLLNIMIDYQGQTESISRSIPIVLNKINFSLFPEGGDLVRGIASKVAFRALNEFGKPADVEGIVLNSKGKQVAAFSSFHNGMGAFEITPALGEKYVAKITSPAGIKEEYVLPEPLARGYVLSVERSDQKEMLLNISTIETEDLSLIGQVRGKVCYATALEAKAGQSEILIPARVFPMGVVQFTLFDSKGIERAERLTFVNKNDQLSVSITTDKEKYLPREKVNMTIMVKDERGMPMPANLSISVVNDQLLSFADDKQGNILSKMLLEYDIKDKVEEPNFYFDAKEPKADKALDYVMMTSGWRRFTWEKVMAEDLPAITYSAEKAIVSGTVLDAYTGKPIANAKLKVNADGTEIETDEKGNFSLKKLDLSNTVNLSLNARGYSTQQYPIYDYNQNLAYYLYPQYKQNYYAPSQTKSATGGWGQMAVPMEGAMVPRGKAVALDAVMEMEERAPVENEGAKFKKDKPMNENLSHVAKQENKKNQIASQNRLAKMNEIVMDDERDGLFHAQANRVVNKAVAQKAVVYYRAKQFAAPVYKQGEYPEQRTDFRSTIYWNPNVQVNNSGKAEVSFFNSDDITSFRTTVEGIGHDGSIGRAEKTCFTQMPFSLTTKIPTQVVTQDVVSIPLTLKNNTSASVSGLLNITAPKGLEPLSTIPNLQTLAGGKAKTIFLEYRVKEEISEGNFEISFKACGMKDAFAQNLKVVPKGFPVRASFSGDKAETEYQIDMRNVVKGSIKVKLTAFPSVVSDLLTGVEGMLNEPGGCFEQTSMNSYPNAMVMDYMKTSNTKDEKLFAYAGGMLDRGYKRLTTFETKEKGYEWFGKAPGHQGLTAYGLMQFNDLKKVYDGVDQKMIDRTAEWILSQKDGKGGFKRNTYALHNFGQISDDVMNGYIVYALTEAGYGSQLKKELDTTSETSMKNKDPYQLAMSVNSLYKLNDKSADKVMKELLAKQNNDGSFDGTTHSITHSTGQSLKIETTSLAILAMLKDPNTNRTAINKVVEYLVQNRNGCGSFGNTQGTVLALKALTEFAKANKSTPEDGTVKFYVDGKKVAEKNYKAGEKDAIVLDNLEQYIKEGKHTLKVKYAETKNPLPHTVSVNWSTSLPNSNKECKVDMQTKLASKSANQGETIRLTATIKNKTEEGLPSPIAIIGIPAGLSLQPWQLKEMQEKNLFDYYEVIGNNLVLYYRGMAPKEEKVINLDLKADIPGEYEAPASSAYLYYTNEYKTWDAGGKVVVKKQV
ncbi:MAG: carboxypeptidase-like regulatory domain-containing protein [Bacteroidetes bacterium]|nr:carboxypeptidase-like regulatory domain-containing protein [Bacteroidota bacterium]